jgi:molybdopterin-guanine dinucleotide biosynthesis protein MobB
VSDSLPPAVAVVGWKNSGKTTLMVALVAELRRRGLRVATAKHGHPHFELDTPGKDSWRHFHEGGAEAVLIASSGRVALVQRVEGEPDPLPTLARHLGGMGYDLVLVEGWKEAPLPRIEVVRGEPEQAPIFAGGSASERERYLAVVSDRPLPPPHPPLIPLRDDGGHVAQLADLLLSWREAR